MISRFDAPDGDPLVTDQLFDEVLLEVQALEDRLRLLAARITADTGPYRYRQLVAAEVRTAKNHVSTAMREVASALETRRHGLPGGVK
jgi:hypothetical protein